MRDDVSIVDHQHVRHRQDHVIAHALNARRGDRNLSIVGSRQQACGNEIKRAIAGNNPEIEINASRQSMFEQMIRCSQMRADRSKDQAIEVQLKEQIGKLAPGVGRREHHDAA